MAFISDLKASAKLADDIKVSNKGIHAWLLADALEVDDKVWMKTLKELGIDHKNLKKRWSKATLLKNSQLISRCLPRNGRSRGFSRPFIIQVIDEGKCSPPSLGLSMFFFS